VTILIDEFKSDSIYWDLFAAEKDLCYRLYKSNGGIKSRGKFLEDLFVEAFPEDERYKIDAMEDAEALNSAFRPRAYRATADADYVYDPDGDFFHVCRDDESGQTCESFYIHRSQFFKPKPYILQGMGVVALAMAAAFQNTQIQMSQMADYIHEAETINSKIADLNKLYSDLNLLLASFTDLSRKYAATVVQPEQNLWSQLVAYGLVSPTHVLKKASVHFRPILLGLDVEAGDDCDWMAFTLKYDETENKIVTKQFPRKNWWTRDSANEAAGQLRWDTKNHYDDPETAALILSLEGTPIHFQIDSADGWRLGSGLALYHDTRLTSEDAATGTNWVPADAILQKTMYGGAYDSGYNADSQNDPTLPLSRYQVDDNDTVGNIIANRKKSLIRVWDVRKYVDDVRQKIECINNTLQTSTARIHMINQDMQANFSTATNMISSVGQQLKQAAKGIRS
jgi:hypothetical protein